MSSNKDKLVIRRALISVADKTGIVEFATRLQECGIEILSTGGTAATLRDASVAVGDVAEHTGFGSVLGGRVKTLHPAVLGGILFDRDLPEQVDELKSIKGVAIDLVVVNYYPFATAVSNNKQLAQLVELIDIGGPTMVRSAAKNHRHVLVVVDPTDYTPIADEIEKEAGMVRRSLARKFAAKAFARNVSYEQSIACGILDWHEPASTVANQLVEGLGNFHLRYGENPHQAGSIALGGDKIVQLGGGALSYNNLQDSIVAWRTAHEHQRPCCAIIKHSVPCGVAIASEPVTAYQDAVAADPISAYGGVIACNRTVDDEMLDQVFKLFAEVLIAPDFTAQALARLGKTKRLKSLRGPFADQFPLDGKIFGGITMYQTQDLQVVNENQLETVSKCKADANLIEQLLFAWRVVKHTRSNAIVISDKKRTLGIGSGQTSRLEATQIAVDRAVAKGFDLHGAVAASDAFFPFADGVEILAKAKIKAVIQPGGSKRDKEVIAAVDAAGMVMIFTGLRHFSH